MVSGNLIQHSTMESAKSIYNMTMLSGNVTLHSIIQSGNLTN